ncbi:MAG: transposase [Marinicella sp.]
MARLPRLNLPDIPQHIVQRGNNRQVCFFSDQDYVVFLGKLKDCSRKYKVAVHAYVLMTNHVHLLMTPSDETGMSRMIQALSSGYVRYINMTYGRTGTLWEGRYKSSLVDCERYFLIVSRYIEMNPVRAKMVSHPSEYPWSSFRRNALGIPIKLITPHGCYQQLGKNDEERNQAYQSLFQHEIPEFTLEEIRDSINKTWVLGNNKFKTQIEYQTGRRVSPLPKGGDRKSEKFKNQRL